MRSLRRWIVLAAAVQAAMFIPLALMAVTGWTPLWLIYLCAALYWGSGLATGPAWSTWIGILVPRRLRARYFGRRSRLCNLGVFAGLATGGLALEYGQGEAPGVAWFAALFAAGFVFRAGCAMFLSLQSETGPVHENHRRVRGRELAGRFLRQRDGRFLIFLMLMQVGVQFSQPFFMPYMEQRLRLSYVSILALIGAAYAGRSLSHPFWGRFAHRYGAMHLLWIGAAGIVPLPVFWLLSDSLAYLVVSQLLAGVLWGAYESATFLLIFETIREDERVSLYTTYNVGNAACQVAGSVLGGWMLGAFADRPGDWMADRFAAVFLVSVAARLVTVLYLTRTREILHHPRPVAIGTDAVRPSAGAIEKPILPSLSEADPSR
jgi:MFS family permease